MQLNAILNAVKFPLILLFILSLISFGIGYFSLILQVNSPPEQLNLGLLGVLSIVSLILALVGFIVIIVAGYNAGKETGSVGAGAIGGLFISVLTGMIFGILNLIFLMPLISAAVASQQGTQDIIGFTGMVGILNLVIGIVVNAIIGIILGALGAIFGKKKFSGVVDPIQQVQEIHETRSMAQQQQDTFDQDQKKYVPKLEKLGRTEFVDVPKQYAQNSQPSFAPRPQLDPVLKEEEKEQVNELAVLLEQDKQGFSPDQVRKAISDKGYSQVVIEEVIKRLYG